jgi:hypothetical protein
MTPIIGPAMIFLSFTNLQTIQVIHWGADATPNNRQSSVYRKAVFLSGRSFTVFL